MIDRFGRLVVEIPETELWDPINRTFKRTKGATLILEHSLSSIAFWESKWKVPFLTTQDKTQEQTMDYIRCMSVDPIDDETFEFLPSKAIEEINKFLGDTLTATFFMDRSRKPVDARHITSELIYYWMTELGIPFECEHWNINRLMTLIKVCNEESKPPQQPGKFTTDQIADRRALNKLRRSKLKTGG